MGKIMFIQIFDYLYYVSKISPKSYKSSSNFGYFIRHNKIVFESIFDRIYNGRFQRFQVGNSKFGSIWTKVKVFRFFVCRQIFSI